FYYLFLKIQKYPKITLFATLLFLVGAVFVVKNISFNEDITRIIPKNKSANTATEVVGEMNFSDKISVIFKKKKNATGDDLVNAAQAFLDTLPIAKAYYHAVQGVLDENLFQQSFDFVYKNLPLYLSEADYQIIGQKLQKDSIAAQMQRNVETLTGGNAAFMKD